MCQAEGASKLRSFRDDCAARTATKPSGKETRVVAAAQGAAAECAGKTPPPEPQRGSRDGRSHDGGGGNRTRVRRRPEQNVYKRSPPLNLARRPEADALPAGQPSLVVAPPAIGSPSVPSPFVGAATRATGPARSDVTT